MIEQKLLRLEQMSSAEKIRHWVQEKPWEADGVALRLPRRIREFSPAQVQLNAEGNITKMPLLIGRPCFGQATAFLRHGGSRLVYSPRQKSWHPTRCARCAVRNACEFVAEERLQCTPKLAELYREWRNLGGRQQTWPTKGPKGSAAVRLPDLIRELQRMNFTSIRDQEIQDHYAAVIERQLVKDRLRKRRDRERQAIERAKAGEITLAVEKVLEGHCRWRAVEHRKASAHSNAPKWLRRLPDDASVFDANVWCAHTRVWLRGDNPTAYSCAAELHRMGLETHRSVNALRDRVARSIERMQRLQRLHLVDQKSPVWPRFTQSDLKEGVRLIDPTN